MPRNSVSIRIGTDGKATVIRDFAEISDAGTVQAQRLRAKWDSEVAGIERATERAARTAERLAAISPNASGLSNTINPVTGGQYSEQNGAAMRSARGLAQELDRAENEARALLAAIDPLFAAQQRYGNNVDRINRLKATGALTEGQYLQLLGAEEAALATATAGQLRHAQSSGLMRAGTQQAAFQFQDMFVQMSSGQRVSVIMAQQLPQLSFALSMIGDAAEASGNKMTGFKGTAIAAARYMTTGWGIAISGGMMLLGTLIPMLMGAASGHDAAEQSAKDHETAEQTLIRALRGEEDALTKLNEAMRERNDQAREAIELDYQRAEAARRAAAGDLTILRIELERERSRAAGLGAAARDPRAAAGAEQLSGEAAAAAARVVELERAVAAVDWRVGQLDVAHARSVNSREGLFGDTMDRLQGELSATYSRLRAATSSEAERASLMRTMAAAEATLRVERERGMRTIQEVANAERNNRSIGARITEADARAIIAGIGGHVTSGTRSAEHNRAVGGVPNSAHVRGQAVDIALTPGMTRGRITEAFRERGVTLRQLLGPGDPGHDDHFHAEWRVPGQEGAARAENLQRQNEAIEASTRGMLENARAWLTSGEAALRAEAMREGATDATRRGTDVAEQQRRQLNLDIAEGAARGAQAVAQMEAEAAAREDVTSRIMAGTLAAGDLQRMMQREAAMRPLLILRAAAHGEELEVITRVIERTGAALDRLAASEANADAAGAIVRLRAANDDARQLLAVRGSDAERTLAEARIAATREAGDKGFGPQMTNLFVGEQISRAQQQLDAARIDYFRQFNAATEDRMALMTAELNLGFMGEAQRERTLRLEETRLELQRKFGPEHAAEIRLTLQKAAAEDELRRRVEQVRDAQREVQRVGEQLIDEVFNIDNWDNWGEAGMRVLRMLAQEMVTLAAINPLKNAVFGQNNPTFGDFLQRIGLGGADYLGSDGSTSAPSTPGTNAPWYVGHPGPGGFAIGTHHAAGGLALVGEFGAELVNLPRGSKVTPAGETRRLLASNDRGIGSITTHISIDATGADPASLARVHAELGDLRDNLGKRIVETYFEAVQRGYIR